MVFDPDCSVLVIFCRRPQPGVGKQRIAATTGKQRAYEVSELLLAAALEDAEHWAGAVVIAPASPTDTEWARTLLPSAAVVPQHGSNLGERIEHVDTQLRAAGAQRIVFIGSDAPTLSPDHLQSAEHALRHHDYVLAPAEDGGVILMGASRPWPALGQLAWETCDLRADLEHACAQQGGTVASLPGGRDIDTEQDLRDALPVLRADNRPGRQALAKWVETHLPETPALTAIVPVLDDCQSLRRLLGAIESWPEQPDELIVVDGADSRECAELCRQFGARYIQAEPCRGHQSAIGAQASGGRMLWFLHADSEPPADAVGVIRDHLGTHDGGFFRFRFAGQPPWYAHVIEWLVNLRTRFGMPYGDQGLFMTRDVYFACGGIAPAPLFEEVGLIRRLRRHYRFGPATATIGVSPRRWERDGWIRRSLHNRYLAISFMLGTPAETLAMRYRNETR